MRLLSPPLRTDVMDLDSAGPPLERPGSRDLDDASARLLVRGAERVCLRPGDRLFGRGQEGDALYVVLSGELEREAPEPGPPLREGDIFGVLEVLSGERRVSTVSASGEVELLRVTSSSLDRLLAERPDMTEKLVQVAERQLLRREIVRLIPEVFGSLDADTLVEMGRVFQWTRLGRGERLFAQGDPGDALYVLISGRLQASVQVAGGGHRVVAEMVPGEIVGEMSLLSGEPRSATVVALRDSVLQLCSRADFHTLLERHPKLSMHLTSILIERLRTANQSSVRDQGRMSIALVPLHEGIELDSVSGPLVSTLSDFGSVLHLDRIAMEQRVGHFLAKLDARLRDLRLLPWFEEQEARHDAVVYEADPALTPWTLRCVGRADRIVLIADADHDPGIGPLEERIDALLSGARPRLHLVLLHPADRDRPRATRAWLDPRQIHQHHHVRRGRAQDVARVARLLTGRGIGVVLSGGGARGFAHIGVLRVIEQLGIPVDAIGGTSAGAGLGAQYASGDSPAEMRDINWREFVERKPFRQYTLPVYSLVRRAGFDRAVQAILGDLDIEDLWIPYFCTSCDIHTGEKVIHRRGSLWKAARASMSLPGIVPPVVDGRRLLVDGGVLDNIPEEEMREFCGGPVIAVDVSPSAPIPIDYGYEEMPSPWAVLWRRLSPFAQRYRIPSLLEVLVRTATVSNVSQDGLVDEVADIVLRPPVSGHGLLDFAAIDRIIEDSIEYSRTELSAWLERRDGPGGTDGPSRVGGPSDPEGARPA